MTLNHTAQLQTAKRAVSLMSSGGRIVFVTSHWAHFYGKKAVTPEYEPVARSKYSGEQALRKYSSDWAVHGVSLIVVSGDAIDGTITPRLLERKKPGLITQSGRALPTIDEFADVIANAAADQNLPSAHTIYVGSTEY